MRRSAAREPCIWDVVITRVGSAKTGHQRLFAFELRR